MQRRVIASGVPISLHCVQSDMALLSVQDGHKENSNLIYLLLILVFTQDAILLEAKHRSMS